MFQMVHFRLRLHAPYVLVWMDVHTSPGDEWQEAFLESLAVSGAFVKLKTKGKQKDSRNYEKSPYCLPEDKIAQLRRDKPHFPFAYLLIVPKGDKEPFMELSVDMQFDNFIHQSGDLMPLHDVYGPTAVSKYIDQLATEIWRVTFRRWRDWGGFNNA